MAPTPPLVLASTSRWRVALLAAAGIPVTTVAPPVDEDGVTAPDAAALARARARAKAEAVAELRPEAWVIGADQVAWIDGGAFGKPRDPADHRARLRALRGRTHTLTTGLCVLGPGVDEVIDVHTRITFRADLGDDEIDAYVDSGEGAGCAGGYAAEGCGAQLIAAVDGDWFNVIGLPVLVLVDVLRRHGWRPGFSGPPGGAPASSAQLPGIAGR